MADDDGAPRVRNCGTQQVHERLLRTDPAYLRARVASENRHWQVAELGAPAGRSGVTVIPTVVHVVWNTDAQNIDMEQITSQIDVLTRDFRKTNSDIGSVPGPFAPLAADARIEFELATEDPSGNPTDGVTRTHTTTTAFSDDDAVKRASTGGADAWPADRYLNIWVCPLAGGLLGYAQFPGGPAATDGVVIRSTAFGTTGTAAAPFDLGRTATHEVGHWLNLRHIWGDDGGGCHGDDFVADTPNCADANTGKPTFPRITCANGPHGDMFMNYMDYVDDDSMFMFTQGQVERMQACLDSDRSSIGHQKPLVATLKVVDDGGGFPTLKFRDDPGPVTLKFADDGGGFPTLKFRDDVATHKFLDDGPGPKLKVIDDGQQTAPGADVPGGWPPGGPGGPGGPGPGPGPDPAPFVLSTPHHSMAWTRSFPGAHQQAMRAYEAQLAQYEAVLAQYAEADAAGQLRPQDRAQAEALHAEYLRLGEELRQLRGG